MTKRQDSPLFLITGPPGAGKTSVAEALLQHFEFGLHLPIDDLRTMVKSGLHESLHWTDETERQFQIAEQAASKVALTYQENGFAVVFDHCRNLPRLDQVCQTHLQNANPIKVLLLPDVETCLHRNHTRTNKDFDTTELDSLIRAVHARYTEDQTDTWPTLDTTNQTLEETVQSVLELIS